MGNNARVEVKGIDACKLYMWDGCTLFLHDALFVPDIQWIFVLVIILLEYRFTLNFYGAILNMYLDRCYYGSGYVLDDFIMFDVNYVPHSDIYSICSFLITSLSNVDVDMAY